MKRVVKFLLFGILFLNLSVVVSADEVEELEVPIVQELGDENDNNGSVEVCKKDDGLDEEDGNNDNEPFSISFY